MVNETTPTAAKTEQYLLSALVDDGNELDAVTALVDGVGAKILKADDLGKRRLAFPIAKRHELNMLSIFFTADTEMVRKLTDALRHAQNIRRHLLTTWAAEPSNEFSRSRSRARTNEVSQGEE